MPRTELIRQFEDREHKPPVGESGRVSRFSRPLRTPGAANATTQRNENGCVVRTGDIGDHAQPAAAVRADRQIDREHSAQWYVIRRSIHVIGAVGGLRSSDDLHQRLRRCARVRRRRYARSRPVRLRPAEPGTKCASAPKTDCWRIRKVSDGMVARNRIELPTRGEAGDLMGSANCGDAVARLIMQ